MLLTIGTSLIFSKKHTYRDEKGGWHYNFDGGKGINHIEHDEDDYHFNIEVALGNVVKYIKSKSLRYVNIENNCGNTKLFIPASWAVHTDMEANLGHIRIYGSCALESENNLWIKGETNIGDIEIHYI